MVEKEFTTKEPVASLDFIDDLLIIADFNGSVCLTENLTGLKQRIKSSAANSASNKQAAAGTLDDDFSDDDIEEKKKNEFVNDEADDADEAEGDDDLEALWNDEPDAEAEEANDADHMEDDSRPADISLEAIKRATTVDNNSDSEDDVAAEDDGADVDYIEAGARISKQQPAFQSNATPTFNAERYDLFPTVTSSMTHSIKISLLERSRNCKRNNRRF